jgi:hypothetical protein
VSPLRAADLSHQPPTEIHTAEFDPLRDEGKAFADRLAQAGVKVRYTCHSGMIHHFYGMAGIIPYTRTALRSVGGAIREALASRQHRPDRNAGLPGSKPAAAPLGCEGFTLSASPRRWQWSGRTRSLRA